MTSNQPIRAVLYPIAALAGLLLLWELAARGLNDPRLPALSTVILEIGSDPGLYFSNTGLTLLEATVGLVVAVIFGFLIALVLAFSVPVRLAFMPFVIAAQSVPLLAIAPLMAVWFGEGFFSKVLVAALLCWFPTAINASRGLLTLDPVHEALFRVHNSSTTNLVTKLRIPNSIGFLHSGIRISAGLAMIGAIIAEYGPFGSGIGHLIFVESLADERNHARMFAATLFAAGAGFALTETANALFLRVFSRFMVRGV